MITNVKNARFFVHDKELEAVHNPHPLDYRYLEDYIEDVEDNGQIRVLTADTDIVPGIRMLHTPAHTRGGHDRAGGYAKRQGRHHRILHH